MDTTNIMAILADHASAIDTSWTLLGAALVFFMQAGFAMVETGFTRSKNAGNIIMKNLMDFSLGTPIYWLIGFGIMFGGTGAIIGGFDFMTNGGEGGFTTLIFQTVFCATAATIVSGAMAERTKFSSYCIYSMVISAVIYPISGHWVWGGGWLAQLGFHDFAGSTAVHMVGGVAALVGAAFLGPRIGKYDKNGKPKAIPGHSLTLGALGVFILWFCWFGFNGASTVAMTNGAYESAASVYVTTNMAAAVATVAVMCITWIRYGKPDVSMTLNGSLAGLVAITAGCDMVTPLGAAIIGICAGFAVVFGIEFVEKVLKIDDPVGAVGVHGVNGALGTLLTGLFAKDQGLFYGHGAHFFLVQLLGVVCVTGCSGYGSSVHRHGRTQAVQGRCYLPSVASGGSARCAGRNRRGWSDRDQCTWLRRREGRNRVLPRRCRQHEPASKDNGRNGCQQGSGRTGCRHLPQGAVHRSYRRWQNLYL